MYISRETPYWKTRKGVIMEEYTTFAKKTFAILNQKVFPNLFLQVGLFTLVEPFSSSEK